MLLWRTLFPELRRYALSVACLTIAPIVCHTQLVLITTTLIYLPGIVLVYLAFALSFSIASADHNYRRNKFIFPVVAVGLTLPAYLISEYAAPAALACAVLNQSQSGGWHRTIGTAFFVSAIVGYALYWSLTDPAARPNVRPEEILLSNPLQRAQRFAVVFPDSLWKLALGSFLESVGDIRIRPRTEVAIGRVIAVASGALIALFLTLVSGRDSSDSSRKIPQRAGWYTALSLILALAAAIAPIALMRPLVVEGAWSTRLWLPILPLASCTTAFLLFGFLRARQRWLVIPLLGFVAGYTGVKEVYREVIAHNRAQEWGTEIREYLAPDGITVALFLIPGNSFLFEEKDYEFTARLTDGWPDVERNRFWAYSSPDMNGQSCGIAWSGESETVEIRRSTRGVSRLGPVSAFLWIQARYDGSIEIHPASVPTDARTIQDNPLAASPSLMADVPGIRPGFLLRPSPDTDR